MKLLAMALCVGLLVLSVSGCGPAGNPSEEVMAKIKLGPHRFLIPERNLLGQRPFWIDFIPGLENGHRMR
ncbi:MAG: hypothetical protein KatS3mg121_0796 [Gammaproteobacteria bacterium]|nr:MAG: hypothetical protein KatS3mg121_0796 [Gammaproteobacteria bacterium]